MNRRTALIAGVALACLARPVAADIFIPDPAHVERLPFWVWLAADFATDAAVLWLGLVLVGEVAQLGMALIARVFLTGLFADFLLIFLGQMSPHPIADFLLGALLLWGLQGICVRRTLKLRPDQQRVVVLLLALLTNPALFGSLLEGVPGLRVPTAKESFYSSRRCNASAHRLASGLAELVQQGRVKSMDRTALATQILEMAPPEYAQDLSDSSCRYRARVYPNGQIIVSCEKHSITGDPPLDLRHQVVHMPLSPWEVHASADGHRFLVSDPNGGYAVYPSTSATPLSLVTTSPCWAVFGPGSDQVVVLADASLQLRNVSGGVIEKTVPIPGHKGTFERLVADVAHSRWLLLRRSEPSLLWAGDLDRPPRELAPAENATFSPDGQWVYLVDVAGRPSGVTLPGGQVSLIPAWTEFEASAQIAPIAPGVDRLVYQSRLGSNSGRTFLVTLREGKLQRDQSLPGFYPKYLAAHPQEPLALRWYQEQATDVPRIEVVDMKSLDVIWSTPWTGEVAAGAFLAGHRAVTIHGNDAIVWDLSVPAPPPRPAHAP